MPDQAQLSRALAPHGVEGSSTSAISRVEKGLRYPSFELVAWLAHLARVPTDAIILGDDEAADLRTKEAAAYREMRAVVLRVEGELAGTDVRPLAEEAGEAVGEPATQPVDGGPHD